MMLEYFSPRVLLDAGIFYPRGATGCWDISTKGHYWIQEYSTPGILLDAGIFHPRGITPCWDILTQGYYNSGYLYRGYK